MRVQDFVFNSVRTGTKRYTFPTHINDMIVPREKSEHCEIFNVIIEKGKSTVFHCHSDNEQIFYVIDGLGFLEILEAELVTKVFLKSGDVVRIPKGVYHSVQADSSYDLKYLCIDCFEKIPDVESTWDKHVEVMCKQNNWDITKVTE